MNFNIQFLPYFEVTYEVVKENGVSKAVPNKKKKEIPALFDTGTLKRFQKESGLRKSEMDLVDEDFDLLELLFWHSVQRAYNQLGQQNPHEREDMENIMSNLDGEGFLEMINEANNIPDDFKTQDGEVDAKKK